MVMRICNGWKGFQQCENVRRKAGLNTLCTSFLFISIFAFKTSTYSHTGFRIQSPACLRRMCKHLFKIVVFVKH